MIARYRRETGIQKLPKEKRVSKCHHLFSHAGEVVRLKLEIPRFICKMLCEKFSVAAKWHGKYCPVKNELRVRRGRKIYRFFCGDCELRFVAKGRPEVVFDVALDVTVPELKRGIASIIDWNENV